MPELSHLYNSTPNLIPPPTAARRLRWLGEHHVLFPLVACLILAGIWAMTFYLIDMEERGARNNAAAASETLAETYEAQTVRSLNEVDRTLKFIKYDYERLRDPDTLADLRRRDLLPPSLVSSVSIIDRSGHHIASTRGNGPDNLSGQDVFEVARTSDSLVVGRPVLEAGEPRLRFSRRLVTPTGDFAGIVIVEVDADFFVSGHDEDKFGADGVMALLGTDGVIRVMRRGDAVTFGDQIDYASMIAAGPASGGVSRISPWDGVRRYVYARELYGFPLAVVCALSEQEQLAPVRRQAHTYIIRAVGASVAAIAIFGILTYLSWQLAQSRARAVDERMKHAEQVEHLAFHDALTALPNRSLCSRLLAQSIGRARRNGKQLAVLFIDLDRFKQINDVLGHDVGDQLLKEVGDRLQHCLRESDVVARLGGDEFVILVTDLDDERPAEVVAQKVISAIAAPFVILSQDFRITASVGISVYPRDGEDEQALMRAADLAMYHAKEKGKNNFQFYSSRLNDTSLERMTLEHSLRHALERNEFELYYQEKRDLQSGGLTGMEALLRWQHPDLGMVPPMKFIPLAEDSGLIVPIGKWVLRTACRQYMNWRNQGMPPLIIAVNLSARQYADARFLDDVIAVLAETGMDPRCLEFEITESMLMTEVERTVHILMALKRMGVRIAIDDFGTGYSSLSTLRQFPLDTIKIDRSFIRDIPADTQEKALARAIIGMGRTLSLTVVAEGVETREQAEFLRENACQEVQGFYFNRPMPAAQFEHMLWDHNRAGGAGRN